MFYLWNIAAKSFGWTVKVGIICTGGKEVMINSGKSFWLILLSGVKLFFPFLMSFEYVCSKERYCMI